MKNQTPAKSRSSVKASQPVANNHLGRRPAILFFLLLALSIVGYIAYAKTPLTSPGSKTPHPVGMNVEDQHGDLWLIDNTGQRRFYPSQAVFLSYAFNSMDAVVRANKGDMDLPIGPVVLPREGQLCVSNSGPDVNSSYIISNGHKLGFSSLDVFQALGFNILKSINLDLSQVPAGNVISNASAKHPKGVVINNIQDIVYMGENGVYAIPDLETFNSWGFNFSDVLPRSDEDAALPKIGVLAPRQAGELNPNVQ